MHKPTLDTISLCQLSKVLEEASWDLIPCHIGGQPQIHMGRREFVDMEPNVCVPPVLYEIFVCFRSS
jgi:hypothetical protein